MLGGTMIKTKVSTQYITINAFLALVHDCVRAKRIKGSEGDISLVWEILSPYSGGRTSQFKTTVTIFPKTDKPVVYYVWDNYSCSVPIKGQFNKLTDISCKRIALFIKENYSAE